MSDILPVSIEQCLIEEIFKSLPIKQLITKKEIIHKLKEDHHTYINDTKVRKYISDIKKSRKEVMIISTDKGYYVTDDPKEKIAEMREIIEIHDRIIKDCISTISYYEGV